MACVKVEAGVVVTLGQALALKVRCMLPEIDTEAQGEGEVLELWENEGEPVEVVLRLGERLLSNECVSPPDVEAEAVGLGESDGLPEKLLVGEAMLDTLGQLALALREGTLRVACALALEVYESCEILARGDSEFVEE